VPDKSRNSDPRLSATGLLVLGTDTGVGKTTLSRAVLRLAWNRGRPLHPFKPVETGVLPGQDPSDATALRAASGYDGPLSTVCPFALSPAITPSIAAKESGITLRFPDVVDHCEQQVNRAPCLIESAGGLCSPLAPTRTNLDLATSLQLPFVLVARNALGTISHTALALSALSSRFLRPHAVILMNTATEDASSASNAEAIFQLTGVRVQGPFPHRPGATDDELALCLQGLPLARGL